MPYLVLFMLSRVLPNPESPFIRLFHAEGGRAFILIFFSQSIMLMEQQRQGFRECEMPYSAFGKFPFKVLN